jgi:predicted dehydrogenase
MANYKVGLVGLRQARQFADIFNAYPEFEVTALCDTDENLLNTLGDELGVTERFIDYYEFVESDLDVIEMSTPIQVHGEHSIAALKNGKHVLCQYIASNDLREAEELIDAKESSGKKYMFIETDCYECRSRIMMALAEKGILGKLITGRGEYNHLAQLNYNRDGSLTWRGKLWKERNGGFVVAVHTAMPLLRAFGERVQRVCAMGTGSIYAPEFRRHDGIFTLAQLSSGRMIELVHANGLPRPARCGYYLQGTRGCFDFDKAALPDQSGQQDWISLDDLETEYQLEQISRDYGGHKSAFALCVDDFVNAIVRDTEPPMDLYDALHITSIGWAAEEAMETGQSVEVIQFN